MKKNWKRILAAMLAASMIFGNAVPAYATESQPVVEVVEAETEVAEDDSFAEEPVEDVVSEIMEETIEENTEPVEDAESEEAEEILIEEASETDTVLEYQASEYLKDLSGEGWRVYSRPYNGGTHYLQIELSDADSQHLYMDEVISALGECETAMLDEKENVDYNSCDIAIVYNNLEGGNSVPASFWNELIEYSEAVDAESAELNFFFFERYGIQYKYFFNAAKKIDNTAALIDMTMSAAVTEESATVTFTNTTFDATSVSVFFDITTLRNTEEVNRFKTYFGTEEKLELEIWEESAEGPKNNFSQYTYLFETSEEDGDYEECEVGIDDVQNLNPGTYELRKAGEGDGEDNENSFNITETVIYGKNILVIDGASHSDYDVFEADVVTALKSQTKKYDGVEISYLNPYVDNYSEYVAKEVWNAAVDILNDPKEDEEVSLWFNRVFENTDITDEEGTYAANSNWHIPNPVTVKDDIYLEVAYDSKTHTLTTGDNNFPANTSAYWNLWTPVNCEDYIVEFGDSEEEITLELCKNGESVGVDAFYCVNYEESDAFTESVNLYAIDVAALEANTSYTLQRKVYLGTVDVRENGGKALNINAGDAGVDSLTDSEVLKILDNYAPGSFREILVFQNLEDFKITKNLANKAKAYLETSDEYDVELKFAFWDDGAKVYYEWNMTNPGTQSADQIVKTSFAVEEGNAPTVSFAKQSLVADQVWTHINVSADANPNFYKWTKEYLGKGEKDVVLEGADAGGWYNYDEESLWMDIRDIQNAEVGTSYNVVTKPYFGKVEELGNGRRRITLSPFDAGKDEAFTLDELKEITTVLNQNDEAYEFVDYIIPISDNNVIEADLAEELRKILLDYEDTMEVLSFTFADEDHSYVIGLLDPSMEPTYGKDVAIDLNIAFDAENKQVSYTQNGIKLDAEGGGFVGYKHVRDSGLGMQLYECFKGKFEFWYPFTEANDSKIKAFYVPQQHNIYFEIDADDLFDGNEKAYKFTQSPYRGVEEEWDNGVRAIAFYPSDLESYGIEFSEKTIADMLEDFTSAGESYDAVVIQYPEIPDSVSADLWNKAVNALSDHKEKCIQLRFCGGAAYDINWHFSHPETTESLDLDVEFLIGEEGEYGTVKFAETDLPVDYAEVNFVSEDNNGEAKTDFHKFRDAFGYEPMIGLDILDSEGKHNLSAEAIYSAEENKYEEGRSTAELCVRNITALESDKIYTFEMSAYRGYVEGDEEWRSIFLTSYAFGKEKLDPADFEEIIEFYVNNNIKFDVVEFEQSNGTSNVIDKDMINLARKIMKDSEESDRRLTFIFCDCGMDEEGNRVQKDLRWNLMNPGIASKDINATVTSSIIENKGVTVKFVANTYSADEVFVSRFVSEGTDLADAYHNALTANTDLMLLKKSSEVVKNRNIGLYTMGEDEDTALEFFVGNVQNLAAATEYLVCDTIYLPEIYAVGNPEDMTTVLSNSVDEKTPVTWKVYSPEKTEVTADEEIKFLSGGGEHFFSAQYKSGGKTIFEFFHAEAELRMTKLAFEKSNYDVEFWPDSVDEEWANRGHLDVKYYPSNAGMDPADLIWEIVNGEDVVRFVPREEDGKFDGEIQGLSIGTATIKVTHPENADLTETVTVNVVEAADYIPEEAWEEMDWLYAFANVDKTLADVELPEGWKWKNPKQSLKNYYDSKGGEFEAIYTKASGQEAKGYLPVEIFKLEEVFALAVGKDEFDNLFAMESPKAMEIGESITWGFDFKLADDLGWDAVIDEIFAEDGKFSIKWSDNLSEIDETSVVWRGESVNYEDCRMFKATTKGTYKFNVSLVDNETSKAVAKYSWSVKVVEKLVDFDQMIVESVVGDEWNKGKLHFLFPVDEYVKISSVKSSDSKVYALGKNLVVEDEHVIREIDGVEVECVDTWVTYEEKASGVVVVTVTAADDAKSTWTDTLDIIEREPKVLHPSVEINKAYADKAAVVNVQFADNFPYAEDSEGIRVVGEYAEKFEYYHSDNRENGWLVLEDATLAKGTYKVQLSIPVDRSYDGQDVYNYDVTVKVKVTDKAPTVKIKQTKNVNLFYTNQSEEQLEGTGAVTIDIGTLDLSYAPFIYEDENVDEDFELVEVDGEYRLIYAPNDDDQIDKNVDIKIGVTHPVFGFIMLTKTVKIKTENKAPALVLSTKTDTLYPKQYVDGVEIYLKDKVTGEKLSFEEVAVVDKNGENVVLNEGYDWENPDTIADFVMSKNRVYVGRITDDYTKVGFFMIDHDNAVNSTEKFTLRVCKENWSNPVNVTYTLKIATKAPKLTLGSSKLTLNMNEDVRNAQYARTTMTLANCSSPFWSDVYFVGADTKSKEALNKAISLEYDMNRGEIVARLNVSESHEYQLKKGTYSFKVWADNWVYKTSTTLKVTIVDTAPEKCIKLSKKGSIDLLQKDSKRMEFTPKLSNLDGTIVDAWIEGPYYYAFNGYFEDGKLVVGANIEYYPEGFNTKHNYSITPVFVIENSDGWHYEVRAAAQSVKVTQSKPKVTVNAYNGNTLYTLAGNSLPLEFNAAVKNTDITIKDVKLLNYTDDLEFEFYEETGTGVLSRGQVKQITTNGKSWSLKFAVTFADSAGNEKPVQVTYKVTIK